VGQTLARLLHDHGACLIQDLKGLDEAEAQRAAAFIQAGRPVGAIEEMRPADLWMFTVPDSRIAKLAVEVASAPSMREQRSAQPTVAFHCSGFFPASALGPLRELGWQLASVHPVLTFADPKTAVAHFRGTPCGLEGDEDALQVLRQLVSAIGGHGFPVLSERKALYHAAAVFASNFTVVLQAIAREAWAASGVPDDVAINIQESLIHATVENVLSLGSEAITGPAARGDTHVVEHQWAEVSRWHPHAGAVYQELSLLARRLAQQQSTLDAASQDPQRPDFKELSSQPQVLRRVER
jgi:predicted short-subunit dehydrogenase-like oxidoreductase (DUF2520 family)